MPVLEAMSSGVPVITSNASCLPEVAGESALFFHPQDVEDLQSKLNEVLENDDTLLLYRQLGISRAQQFSWQRCAQETLDVYKKLAAL